MFEMEESTNDNLVFSKHFNSKMRVIESTLHQTIYNFKDILTEFEKMMTESVQKQVKAQKEKCERKTCTASKELKKVIESKENIIQLIASSLTKLNETKDFNILTEVFKIIFGELNTKNNVKAKEEKTKGEIISDNINIEAMALISPKQELLENMSIEEQDISVSQIDGTPTGRLSPIIQSRKLKSSTNNTALRDKKKCPDSWITPEKKNMKVLLTYPTPTRSRGNGRLRQQRITLVREKPSTVVDLTTTPQFSKGRNSQSEERNNIKLEVIENDDTIMPSPTSGPVFAPAYKSITKESPQKFKKPLSLIRAKADNIPTTECKENMQDVVTKILGLEESVDLLKGYQKSPDKRPLEENVNAVNTPPDAESSMSILRRELKKRTDPVDDSIKRAKGQIIEPLYKEATVRKKAEKRALPGWSCEQCKNFYGELYKDDLEMQAKKMDECSKHRGRNNPVQPKTPPGYWYPRWNVPEDTEEFNRRNNAV